MQEPNYFLQHHCTVFLKVAELGAYSYFTKMLARTLTD